MLLSRLLRKGVYILKPKELTYGFAPIYNNRTKILILGTAPSVISLKKKQYYANPGNQFWKIIFDILSVTDPLDYQQRIEYLKWHRLGLWDVYAKFERKGSLDSNFSTVIPNDFSQLLATSPIKLIIANGKLSYKEALKNQTLQNMPILCLPSTSGANNAQMTQRKIAWHEALNMISLND